MRSRLAAVAAALVLSIAGVAGEPTRPRPDDTPQISFEVRVLSVTDNLLFERIGIDFESPRAMPEMAQFPALPDGGVLTDSQVRLLLEVVQGDRRANVIMAPKVTVVDGQDASIQCMQRKTFVTGVDAVRVSGQTVLMPKNTDVDVGLSMKLSGRIAADRKSILARIKLTSTEVGNVEMIPVVTQVMPASQDGKVMKVGKPLPFTQFIQSPQIDTMTIEKKDLTIPIGGHSVLVGPEQVREARQEFGPPVLSKIPYINRMFKNVGVGRETVRTILIVTPRVLEAK